MNLGREISTCKVNTMPVDGLAPLGTMTSVGTVMTKFRSHIYISPDSKVRGANMGPINQSCWWIIDQCRYSRYSQKYLKD